MNLLTGLGTAAAALIAIASLARMVWRANRRLVVIVNAVQELTPNGGQSIKDTVTRTERKVDETAVKMDETASKVDENTHKLCELEQRLNEHLSDS